MHADRFAPLSLAGLKYKLACGSLVFKFESKWVEFYEPALRSSVHVHKLPATEEGVDEADFAANSGALIRNVNASVADVPFSSVRSTTTRVSLCPLALSRARACLPAYLPAGRRLQAPAASEWDCSYRAGAHRPHTGCLPAV
jgi:hypothetical protein